MIWQQSAASRDCAWANMEIFSLRTSIPTDMVPISGRNLSNSAYKCILNTSCHAFPIIRGRQLKKSSICRINKFIMHYTGCHKVSHCNCHPASHLHISTRRHPRTPLKRPPKRIITIIPHLQSNILHRHSLFQQPAGIHDAYIFKIITECHTKV